MNRSQTITDDSYESDYLEPWAQWVSVHTGVPSSKHNIKHLGDVENLKFEQLWETLSKHDVDSGIWGVMNGTRASAQKCKFFIADPWTWSAPVYPASLACLSDLSTYIAKNYLNLSKWKMVRLSLKYGVGLLTHMTPVQLIQSIEILLQGLLRFGPNNLVLGAFFEFTSACCFFNAYEKYRPRFAILFLNLIAHTQHHYWSKKNELTPQLTYAFRVIERIASIMLNHLEPIDELLIANGLSQTNTADEPAWILYRPHDPLTMLRAIGINPLKFESLMTHDLHIWLSSPEECRSVKETLTAAKVQGKSLFLVEQDKENNQKLFCRLQFTDQVQSGETFSVHGKTFRFDQFFQTVVRRTGKHIPNGFAMQSRRFMPEVIANHQIHHYICQFFNISSATEKSQLTKSLVVA